MERFNDKYACDEMLGVYKYGRSNSVILKEAIKDYDKLDEAGQDKQILENFTHIKRVVDYSDEKLVDAIRNEEIKLYEYEYLLKTPGFSNITIALLVKYDVILESKKFYQKNNSSIWIYGIFKLSHLRKIQTPRKELFHV